MNDNKLIYAGRADELKEHIERIAQEHETIGELEAPEFAYFQFETYNIEDPNFAENLLNEIEEEDC